MRAEDVGYAESPFSMFDLVCERSSSSSRRRLSSSANRCSNASTLLAPQPTISARMLPHFFRPKPAILDTSVLYVKAALWLSFLDFPSSEKCSFIHHRLFH